MPRVTKTFTETELKNVALEIAKAPKKERRYSISEAVLLLKPQIDELRKGGYSFAEIKKILQERGIKTTISALYGRKFSAKKPRKKDTKDENFSG